MAMFGPVREERFDVEERPFPQQCVLTIALQELAGGRAQNWHLLTSAAFISMSLPLVVFFSLQRYFVRGLTAGSVKG